MKTIYKTSVWSMETKQ